MNKKLTLQLRIIAMLEEYVPNAHLMKMTPSVITYQLPSGRVIRFPTP